MKSWSWLVLGTLLAVSAYVAVFKAPSRTPEPGVESTHWLAATSLASDGDLAFVDEDVRRFRDRFGAAPRDVRTLSGGDLFAAPPLSSRAWAAAMRISPVRGPYLLNWILFAASLFVAAWVLGPTLGESTALWVALLGFGSISFAYVNQLQPEVAVLFAVVLACALVWGRRSQRIASPEQIYAGELAHDAVVWRWPLAGLALGAAAVRSPAYLLLALPMMVDLPRPRRALAGAFFLGGLALPVAFVAGVAGAPWDAAQGVFTPALLGWNLLYLLLGRSAGVLIWFLPVVAVLALSRGRGSNLDGRSWIPHAVLAAALLQLLLYPFDWAGERVSNGNPWFLPLFGALWFALDPRAGEPRRAIGAAALVAVVASPFLLPHWLWPAVTKPALPAAVRPVLEPVRTRPPFETSLREIPGSHEIRRGGARLRSVDPAIGVIGDTAGGRVGGDRLSWFGSRRATVVLESDRPLSSVRLELGERAPSGLDVSGGEAGNTLFRPSGEVAFDVQLSRPARRHPLWWSREPASIYFLELAIPERPPAPIPFDLGLVRPVSEGAPGADEDPARLRP